VVQVVPLASRIRAYRPEVTIERDPANGLDHPAAVTTMLDLPVFMGRMLVGRELLQTDVARAGTGRGHLTSVRSKNATMSAVTSSRLVSLITSCRASGYSFT
jgi:hypothetical protein